MRRRTVDIQRLILEIRAYLRARTPTHKTCRGLKISEPTFYRYLARIREEDEKWLNQLGREGITSAYRLAIDGLF